MKTTTLATLLATVGATLPILTPCQAAPADWTIESQADWESNTESKTGIEFQDGMAVPSEPSATFRS
ncbi:MAG: hypothetical protein ACO3GO_07175, partial [Terrimicrobiaceae bacterium]